MEEEADRVKVSKYAFKEYVKNIACNSFAKQVKNLNFYKNGELDFRAVVDEIRKIVKSAQSACIDYNFLDIEFDNEIYKRCLEIFLDGTHILTDGNREGQKSEIVKKVFSPAERIGPNSKKPANIYFHNLEEVYKDSYNALPFKLAKIKLENNQELLKDGKIELNPLYQFVEDENSTQKKVSGSLLRTENAMKNTHKLLLAGYGVVI